MLPVLKGVGSLDVDVRTWRPSGAGFAVTLDLEIGVTDGPGSDVFHLYVCSPAHLLESMSDSELASGRHLLLTKTFDYGRIRGWIDEVLLDSEGADWDAVTARLSRHFAWEFEDLADPGA